MRFSDWKRGFLMMLSLAAATVLSPEADAQVVPGTGFKVEQVGDDFEDADWEYTPNWPKASQNLDGDQRQPLGEANNGRWYESGYRGQPDIVRRVLTPAGGLPGSKGSLMLQTKLSGIPGMITRKQQQDDFLANVNGVVGAIPVRHTPSVVARIYLPPWDEWEQRSGASFGFRADLEGLMTKDEEKRGLFGIKVKSVKKQEAYWPGFFIQFNSKNDPKNEQDSALILIRSDELGRDLFGPYISEPGWWTFGMSFTPDGKVHYYASPGVDRLTQADYITSNFPYNAKAEKFVTFFFNVINEDDAKKPSTKWIIDDPEVYVGQRWW